MMGVVFQEVGGVVLGHGKFSGGVRFSSKDMTRYGLIFAAWWDEFDFFKNSRFVLGCWDIVRSTVLFCFVLKFLS